MDDLTCDWAGTPDGFMYYATDAGGTWQITPEGFLLIQNIPIARTGTQLYADGEIPVQSGPDRIIRIHRTEDEVFRPETIASANGKPVVIEHPNNGEPVTPDNWNEKAVGIVMRPRRGDGRTEDNQKMYADLMITNGAAVKALEDKHRKGIRQEVSAGYNAEYSQDAPGVGRQRNIVINHVALVDRGRCGPQCSIGDALTMSSRAAIFRAKFRRMVHTRDEGGALNLLKEAEKDPDLLGEVLSGDDVPMPGAPDQPHHVTINVHGGKPEVAGDAPDPSGGAVVPPDAGGGGGGDRLGSLEARMEQVEQVLAMIAEKLDVGAGGGEPQPEASPEEGGGAQQPPPDDNNNGDRAVMGGDRRTTGDSRRAMVGDSTSMQTEFLQMLSKAEILMPGIQLLTFDSAKSAKDTSSSMCNFKRRTLQASAGTDRGRAAIETAIGGPLPQKYNFHDAIMTCDGITTVFNAASALMAAANNGRAHSTAIGAAGNPGNGFGVIPTIASLNERNNKFWAARNGG